MSHCLCIYYSRTGNTRAVMGKIAELLDAELLEITDGKGRKGPVGFVAAGLDAMKKRPKRWRPLKRSGRWGSMMRSFWPRLCGPDGAAALPARF